MKAPQICWFEIPVTEIDRAIEFYSSILSVKIEKRIMNDKFYGFFDKQTHLIGGCLAPKENYSPGNGTLMFFYVIDLSQVLINTVALNGKIVSPKTLLKQTNSSGNTIISNNLIDENIGYFAEIVDSEGNHIGLYSHS
jgi:predicted enzyme related to lactoylglutathione lyase